MEEHVDKGGADEATPPVVNDKTELLSVNREEPRRGGERCAQGCSRAVHCSLTLPFLMIIALVSFSVACFYANQDGVGGCVLFGAINATTRSRNPHEGTLRHGPRAVCLTVTGGEMVLCAFALLFAIILVVKAFRHSRMFTRFVFLELFLVFLVFLVSVGLSSIMNVGINFTCASINPGSPCPNFTKCRNVKVSTDQKHPVWDTLLQESLVASWISTLIYLFLVIIWVMLSLFTCCAINSRKSRARGRGRRVNYTEGGMPIMQEPNVVYGAT